MVVAICRQFTGKSRIYSSQLLINDTSNSLLRSIFLYLDTLTLAFQLAI